MYDQDNNLICLANSYFICMFIKCICPTENYAQRYNKVKGHSDKKANSQLITMHFKTLNDVY